MKLLFIICLPFLLAGCSLNAETIEEFAGTIFPVHETFQSIDAKYGITIEFTQHKTHKIEIASKEMIDAVDIRIANGILFIRGKRRFSHYSHGVIIKVFAPNIEKIRLQEESAFISDKLHIYSSLLLFAKGRSEIIIKELNAQTCSVSVEDESDVNIVCAKSETCVIRCNNKSNLHMLNMDVNDFSVAASLRCNVQLSGNVDNFTIHSSSISFLNIEELFYQVMTLDSALVEDMFSAQILN